MVGSQVRAARSILIAAALVLVPAQQAVATNRTYNIPSGELGPALILFGKQSDMTVGLTDPLLASQHTKGIRGRYSPVGALKRLLKGTGATFVQIDAATVRIVRSSERPKPALPTRVPARETVPQSLPTIIVTGSKIRASLRDYPGAVQMIDGELARDGRNAADGSAAIVQQIPVVASTNLGPGRNKLFIRGIADSSFNGSSPATVGQYLGDVRLTYNAPDPNLNLYDMDRIEVLEGPQGTLYGAGSLGGIIRLLPNEPDDGRNAGSLAIGGVSVAHGAMGRDAAGMANLVIDPGAIALRVVAFSSIEPGYIDDPARQKTNINRTSSHGFRAALRGRAGEWKLTLGGAMQNIAMRDGQYVLRGEPALERNSPLAQPFDNDYALAYLNVERSFGSTELVSTTSIVRHDVNTSYDATVDPDAPRIFNEEQSISLISHETRLSNQGERGSWVVGLSGMTSAASTKRTLGDPASPVPILGVHNRDIEVAAFGQYSHKLSSTLSLTGGARLAYTHSNGELIGAPEGSPEPTRHRTRFLPMAALGWRPNDKLFIYAKAQSAFRPGLLVVSPTGAVDAAIRVHDDTLSAVEAGVRYGDLNRDRFSLGANIARARWKNIQADLVDMAGLPYAANIGDGRISTMELQARWRPSARLDFDAALFFNQSTLDRPAPEFASSSDRDLPNIPHLGARAGFSFRQPLAGKAELQLTGSARYFGKSYLGIGDPLNVPQGDYVDTSLGARLSLGNYGLSLDVTNLFDARGNRFAYGNPFGVADKNQVTPQTPRRIRVGIDARF